MTKWHFHPTIVKTTSIEIFFHNLKEKVSRVSITDKSQKFSTIHVYLFNEMINFTDTDTV